jgi:hypothetical protein
MLSPLIHAESFLRGRRFAYAVLASDELVAVADAINFKYDDGRTTLYWTVGNDVNPLIWIALFLVLATIINMAPVKVRRLTKWLPLNTVKSDMRVLVVRRDRVCAGLPQADLHYHAHRHDGHFVHDDAYVSWPVLSRVLNADSILGNSEIKRILRYSHRNKM